MDVLAEIRAVEFMIFIILIMNLSWILYKLIEDTENEKNKRVKPKKRRLYNIDLKEDALWENVKD